MEHRATSVQLFSAAIILAVEARFHANESEEDYRHDIRFCIVFLNGVKDQSIIAERAVELLQAEFPIYDEGAW